MSNWYTEADYEKSVMELFEDLGYKCVYGPDVERDVRTPLYEEELRAQLYRLNSSLPNDALTEAFEQLSNIAIGELTRRNEIFTDYLQNGVPVRYFADGEERSALVYLVDYENLTSNSFIAANQWTIVENIEKRPDIVLFINGLPVVVIELKSPAREETNASEAYLQLRNDHVR